MPVAMEEALAARLEANAKIISSSTAPLTLTDAGSVLGAIATILGNSGKFQVGGGTGGARRKVYTRNEWRRCATVHSKRVEKMR